MFGWRAPSYLVALATTGAVVATGNQTAGAVGGADFNIAREAVVDPYMDISGRWLDAYGGPQRVLIKHFEDAHAPITPPNTTFALQCVESCWWRGGFCRVGASNDGVARTARGLQLLCELDVGTQLVGRLARRGDVIEWAGLGAREVWQRSGAQTGRLDVPHAVKRVHVVLASSYEAGHRPHGDSTGPRAPADLPDAGAGPGNTSGGLFGYVEAPELLQRYLHCPCPDARRPCPARTLGNPRAIPLPCPTRKEREALEAGVLRGDVAWSAVPSDLRAENVSPELFEAALRLSGHMDLRFRGAQRVRTILAQGVAYETRGILPLLRKHRVMGLVISPGSVTTLPRVPKLHRWLDRESGASVLVVYQPFGDTGLGLPDCAEAPNGVALCVHFSAGAPGSQHAGPMGTPDLPTFIEEILGRARIAYPGAQVIHSTFEHFINDVRPIRHVLPVLDLEVGDAWACDAASDPLKTAQSRAIQRVWAACLSAGEARCAHDDPAIANMTAFLLTAPARTQGQSALRGCCQVGDYNATRLRSRLSSPEHLDAAAGWAEQRFLNELAVRALEEARHPLASAVRAEVQEVTSFDKPGESEGRRRQLHNLTAAVVLDGGRVQLQFGEDGAITSFKDGSVEWASTSSPLAAFAYRTFSDADWQPPSHSYCAGHQELPAFGRPGSGPLSESRVWRPHLQELWVDLGHRSVLAVLSMPRKSYETYGAPRQLRLNVSVASRGADSNSGRSVHLQLTWSGKRPTLVGEAATLAFRPFPALLPSHAHRVGLGIGQVTQRRVLPRTRPMPGSAWRLEKLGAQVDPEAVVDGGAQFGHGVWGGALAHTHAGLFRLESLDTASMHPVLPGHPFGNPLPVTTGAAAAPRGTHGPEQLAPGSVSGMAVSLHSNLRKGGSPLYYPFYDPRYCTSPGSCLDSKSKFRFRLTLGGAAGAAGFAPAPGERPRSRGQLHPLSITALLAMGGMALLLAIRALHHEGAHDLLAETLAEAIEQDADGHIEMLSRDLAVGEAPYLLRMNGRQARVEALAPHLLRVGDHSGWGHIT